MATSEAQEIKKQETQVRFSIISYKTRLRVFRKQKLSLICKLQYIQELSNYCPNVSTTPITAMGCRQCLPLSIVQLKGRHCRKPHEVVQGNFLFTLRSGIMYLQTFALIRKKNNPHSTELSSSYLTFLVVFYVISFFFFHQRENSVELQLCSLQYQ